MGCWNSGIGPFPSRGVGSFFSISFLNFPHTLLVISVIGNEPSSSYPSGRCSHS